MFPYWLEPFFTYLPVYGWFFLGIGIPWALALLPRQDWRDRVMLLALALALGPVFGTTWLFLLGTWGKFTLIPAVAGTVVVSAIGVVLAWRASPLNPLSNGLERGSLEQKWSGWEIALIIMMGIGFAAHVWIAMFFPFVQYDTLWTFGYNPRVFLTFGEIPDWIGYYPQNIPLTYTFGQLIDGSQFNDHVAKAAVPWFFLGSSLMAYVLGARIWGRRSIGLLTAALWMLIPSALYWSGTGDLEHPMALYFTGAVLFFVLAWQTPSQPSPASRGGNQWRYALISGLLFAGALWTKPTAASFALGVMLVIGVMAVYLWLPETWKAWLQYFVPSLTPNPSAMVWRGEFRQKFMLAVITALACLPIGGMWYVRNVIYGHEAITFPADYWRTFAQRSGQEFGWLLVIAVLAVGYLLYKKSLFPPVEEGSGIRLEMVLTLLGLVTILVATLPNALYLKEEWTSFSAFEWAFGLRPPSGRLSLWETAALISGLVLLGYGLRGYWKALEARLRTITILMVLLITPFTIVWFYSYSYHARLMLTITPVLASFAAALIEAWIIQTMQKNRARRIALTTIVVLLCTPGIVIGSWLTMISTFVDPLHHDEEKYAASNEALMLTVNWLRDQQAQSDEPLVVYTFGEQRINFFFPENRTILRDVYPTEFDDLRPDTDYLLGGQLTDFLWSEQGVYPNQLSAYMVLGFTFTRPYLEYGHNIPDSGRPEWTSPLNPQHYANDASTQLIGYAYLPELRFNHPDQIDPPLRLEAVHWDLISLHGLDFRSFAPYNTITYFFSPGPAGEGGFPYGYARVPAGQPTFLQLYWQRTGSQPFEQDYVIFIHLRDADTGEIVSQRDGEMLDGTLPTTLLPYPDLIIDRREWMIPATLEPGRYDLYIGFFDPDTFERLPVYQGETLIGDGILIEDVVEIVPQEDIP